MKIEFSRQFFEKYSNVKFHENPFSESWVVPSRWADGDDEAIVAFNNFAKAPKNAMIFHLIKNKFPLLDDLQLS
jgi:hypothetical protein